MKLFRLAYLILVPDAICSVCSFSDLSLQMIILFVWNLLNSNDSNYFLFVWASFKDYRCAPNLRVNLTKPLSRD